MKKMLIVCLVILTSACSSRDEVPGWAVNRAAELCGGQDKVQSISYAQYNSTVVCENGIFYSFKLEESK